MLENILEHPLQKFADRFFHSKISKKWIFPLNFSVKCTRKMHEINEICRDILIQDRM